MCKCQTGFRARGDRCEDIDECGSRTHKCNANADCANVFYNDEFEGYLCKCHNGWMSIGTGRGPFGCIDVDECALKLHECHFVPPKNGIHIKSSMCTNTMGSYKCACTDGWQGNGRTCDNIDECRVANIDCHFNAECEDKVEFLTSFSHLKITKLKSP